MPRKKEISTSSEVTLAMAREFANGFFVGHLWDIMLWPRSSRRTADFHSVARDGGVVECLPDRHGSHARA